MKGHKCQVSLPLCIYSANAPHSTGKLKPPRPLARPRWLPCWMPVDAGVDELTELHAQATTSPTGMLNGSAMIVDTVEEVTPTVDSEHLTPVDDLLLTC